MKRFSKRFSAALRMALAAGPAAAQVAPPLLLTLYRALRLTGQVHKGAATTALRGLLCVGVLILSSPAWAVVVYVQHLRDVDQSPVLVFKNGPDYMLSANILTGEFKLRADAQGWAAGLSNANSAGTLQPLQFTNTGLATITIAAGRPAFAPGGPAGLHAVVNADLIGSPPFPYGPAISTSVAVTGVLMARIQGAAGQREFVAGMNHQEVTLYNPDGSVQDFVQFVSKTETGGALAFQGGGSGLVNINLLMPQLVLDPGDRLELSFSLSGNASDSSTIDAYNTARLSLTLPYGVTLANDSGQPLSWVTNAPIPEPSSLAMFAIGLGIAAAYVRRRELVEDREFKRPFFAPDLPGWYCS